MTSLNGYTADAGVSSALARAAKALTDAGWEVEEAAPPHFQEAAELWSPLVLTEARFALVPAMHAYGDSKVIRAIDTWTEVTPALDLREFSAALGRREQILRAWRQFFEKYPVLITPPSWRLPFPVDLDQQGPEAFKEILRAQSPMLAVALLGLPGLTVPTGFHSGVPTGVQIVADRFREDLCFDAGEVVEGAHPMPTPTDPRTAPAR
jgi:amidase